MTLEALAFVKAEWVKPLWKQLGRINGERAKKLDRLRDEFVDPEELARFYVEPDTQDRNPADVLQDDILPAARQAAFKRINEFFRGSLPLEKDGRHQMFILSDAGMGKTSLLLMIKLMHLTNFWPQGYNCELFKLGEDTLNQIRSLPDKGETVLLLDALDEDPMAWKRIRERLLELLGASEDFRRVIISSRTQFFPKMESDSLGRPEIKVLSGYYCPVLYLSPFNDEQVQEFLDKKLNLYWCHYLCLYISQIKQFKKLQNVVETIVPLYLFQAGQIKRKRERAIYLLKQMQDLRMRPMLLQHIDKLLAVDDRQEWNAYTVYYALILQWLDREVRKLREQHDSLGRLPERDELFHACLRIAEKMEEQRKQEVSEEELQKLICEDKNIRWLEKFELGGRSLLNRNSDRAFRFSHYTIQEFLLAYSAVNNSLSGLKLLQATDQLVRFVHLAAGISACNKFIDMTEFDFSRYKEKYFTTEEKLLYGIKGTDMTFLAGGYFEMRYKDIHEAGFDRFSIGRYPVNYEEYDFFCESVGKIKPKSEGSCRGHQPVVNVSWEDANEYCQWLSKETGHTYRLPTEDEWEYACRAGSASLYCFGDDEKLLADYAWYAENAGGKTHQVGEKKANIWGLYDMHGNVWEWCADWYQQDLYRVARGGSWLAGAQSCRSDCREKFAPSLRYDTLGFRVVRELK